MCKLKERKEINLKTHLKCSLLPFISYIQFLSLLLIALTKGNPASSLRIPYYSGIIVCIQTSLNLLENTSTLFHQ